MKFGQFEIRTFVEQHFRLDGGLMFGVVPKTIWQKLIPPDSNNLIPFVNNLFLLKAHGKHFLFDCGLGDTLSDREKKIYGTTGHSAIETGLAEMGLSTTNIDYVLLTHLHTDHCGGIVKMFNGTLVPRFPNAAYVVSRLEWEAATHPDERTSSVYIPERLWPIERAGQLDIREPDCQLFPGINLVFTGGHSEGHYGIEMESDSHKVFYYSDMFPTVHHMKTAFVPATDVYPLQTMAIKRYTVPRLIRENVTLCFGHDINVPFGVVNENDGRIFVEKLEDNTLSSASQVSTSFGNVNRR